MTQVGGMISAYHGQIVLPCYSSIDKAMLIETGKIHTGDLLFEKDTGNTVYFDGSQYVVIATQKDFATSYEFMNHIENCKVERVKARHCPDCGAPVDFSARVCVYCGVPYPIEYE